MSAILPKGQKVTVVGLIERSGGHYDILTESFIASDGMTSLSDIQRAYYLMETTRGSQIVAMIERSYLLSAVIDAIHEYKADQADEGIIVRECIDSE